MLAKIEKTLSTEQLKQGPNTEPPQIMGAAIKTGSPTTEQPPKNGQNSKPLGWGVGLEYL